jgi:aspartyl-tRNA(Asn)/glutamyl-tRNA(Gln) amidotransferase subunit C
LPHQLNLLHPEEIVAITEADVRHLAKLANLGLSDGELRRMATELEAIVGYVQQLQAVDTAGVEPVANVAGLANVTRPDVPGGMLSQRDVLGNAPQKNEVAILVPKVVER